MVLRDNLTTNQKQKLASDINNAQSLDELKNIMLKMVDSQPTIDSSRVRGWVDSIKSSRSTIAEANAVDISIMEGDMYYGIDRSDEISDLLKCDGLVSLKYIKSTRKQWACTKCNNTIHVGSEAFRSFRRHNEKKFDKLYHCVDCMGKIVKELDEESNEAIHTIAYHDAMSNEF